MLAEGAKPILSLGLMVLQGMKPVLTAQAQREADRLTIEQFGLPGLTLMETAGRAAAMHISEALDPIKDKRVDIVAGKGNNGGDGYVAARALHALGARVRVWEAGGMNEISEDAAYHRRLLATIAARALADSLALLPLESVVQSHSDVYVDALLGTGLSRPLRPRLERVVRFLNSQPAPVVSIDIPTGLHADTGMILGEAVEAGLTIAMGTLKPGHLLDYGPTCAGRTIPVDIGIPKHIVQGVQQDFGSTWQTTDAGVQALLPHRSHDVHKYSVGMVLVVGGSPGLTGAAVMASQAAARAGAGYVTCATHASVQPVLATKLTAIATVALPESAPGDLDVAAARAFLREPLRKAKALLVGPGLGRGHGTKAFARALLKDSVLPAVLDADGLNSWVGLEHEIAQHSQGRWILTPHAGEFGRLTGGADTSDRTNAARIWAKRWDSVVVAKGMPSVVGTPSGEVYICGAGNSSLATAGTGDVLAGLCAGLLAQGLSPAESAVAALHLGGLCADHYARLHAPQSMAATDMLTAVPHVLRELSTSLHNSGSTQIGSQGQ